MSAEMSAVRSGILLVVRPPTDQVRDPLLDPYRNRGGDVRDQTGRRGVAFVSTDTWWTRQRGWKRPRWVDPQELPHLWLSLEDGWFNDYVLPSGDVPSLTDEWADGRLGTFNHATLTVGWRDETGSAEIRAAFGI
jgi:hypothetical protein